MTAAEPHRAFGPLQQTVRAEAVVAGKGAAHHEREVVRDDRELERGEQHRFVMEQVVVQLLESGGGHDQGQTGEDRSQQRRPLHERRAADTARAPVRDAHAPPPARAVGRTPG